MCPNSPACGVLLAGAAPVLALNSARRPPPAKTASPVSSATRPTPSRLPGVPVEVVGGETVYTDVDGRYVLELVPGSYDLKVAMDGYQERTVKVDVAAGVAHARRRTSASSMAGFAETVTVRGRRADRRRHLVGRKRSSSSARTRRSSPTTWARRRCAATTTAMPPPPCSASPASRSSTTSTCSCAASASATATPRCRAPRCRRPSPTRRSCRSTCSRSGLLDSVQVAKSYSPDKSAEFAGGLVQVEPDQAAEPPGGRLLLRPRPATSIATGKSIPLSPLGSRDWLGFDNGARALPGSLPRLEDRPPRHLHADRRLHAGPRSPPSAAPSTTPGGRRLPTARRARTGAWWSATASASSASSPASSQSYQETVRRGEPRVLPRRRRRRSSKRSATTSIAVRHAARPARRRRQPVVPVRRTNHRLSFENFYTHSGRDEGRVLRRAEHREQLLLLQQPRCSSSRRACSRTACQRRALLPRAVEQPARLAGDLRARQPRRAGPARDALPGDARAARRRRLHLQRHPVLADESQSGFRMFNDLDDNTLDVAANWSIFSTAGDRPTQYKFGAQRRRPRPRDFQSRRFRFIPITTGSGSSVQANLTAHAGRDLHLEQHRHRVPLQRRDASGRCLRRRADDLRRLRHGRHRPAGPHPPRGRRPRRALRAAGRLVRPVRPVRRARSPRRTRTPTSSRRSTWCRAIDRQLEPAPRLQRHGQPPGVPRAGDLRVHRRRRRPRGARQPRPAARHHPERRRPLGAVPGRPQRAGGERASSSTSTSPSSAS